MYDRDETPDTGFINETPQEVIAEAEAAFREYDLSRREHGQMALVLWSGTAAVTLAASGSVFAKYLALFDDPPEATRPTGDGLWLWCGWAYITSGSPEYPYDCDVQFGGEYRRLTDAEAIAFARDGDLRNFTTEGKR